MARSAVLFVLVGLAVGLWLGFNPTTHRDLERWWARNTTRQTAGTPGAALSLRQVDRRVTAWFRSAARPSNPPPAQTNSVPNWHQVSTTLQDFVRALQQIWLEFQVKLGIHPA